MQETQMWVWSLCREDPLEEGLATHSRILAWRIPCTKELGRLQAIGSQRIGHDWSDLALTHTGTSYKWNHPAFVFLWLAYLTQHNVLKIYLCGSAYQNFLSFKSTSYSIVWIDHILFFHWSMDNGLFPHFGHCEWCFYKHGCTDICLRPCFQFLWVYTQNGIFCFSFLFFLIIVDSVSKCWCDFNFITLAV